MGGNCVRIPRGKICREYSAETLLTYRSVTMLITNELTPTFDLEIYCCRWMAIEAVCERASQLFFQQALLMFVKVVAGQIHALYPIYIAIRGSAVIAS